MHAIITDEEHGALVEASADLPKTTMPAITWWERGPKGDPRAHLSAVWRIGDVSMHADALAVHMESDEWVDAEDGFRQAAIGTPEAEDIETNGGRMEFDEGVEGYEIGSLWTALCMDGGCETVEIEGRRYAVFASPFCT